MEKHIFEKFYFLFFDLDSEIIKPSDFTHSQLGYIEDIYIYIETFLINKLIFNEFDKNWKSFGFIINKFHQLHNNNLTNVYYLDKTGNKYYPYQENLKEIHLNNYIINFIKNNFIIIKDKINITDKPSLWYQADEIKPFKMFHENLTIFEGYNTVYSQSDFEKSNINLVSFQSTKFLHNLIIKMDLLNKNIQIDIFNKISNLKKKYNSIYNKISLLKKANELNIKKNKIFSLDKIIDLIDEQNNLSKKIIIEKNNIQNGILFIPNIKK
ncbi:hypothetical protein crov173 [Cafeteria roenbergensis virus]|uniref:Uncharacterized protein n=1 Tax=Cafeteria roenbergensis virus (strain BV-PW1) TaxID=693272 RepID=E3T4U3_CROVB|nr:hypothetical protein crov173 [Cafeteria roenbergensis virus BV-PW1]ADO67206.1 hypothetical protein crov173 [Cafeteria roenbergensis virus BV-PW1]